MSQEKQLGRGEESFYGNQIYASEAVWNEAPGVLTKYGLASGEEVVSFFRERGWFLTMERARENGYYSQSPFVCARIDFSENGVSNRISSKPGRRISFGWGKHGITVGVRSFLGIGDLRYANIEHLDRIEFVEDDIIVSEKTETDRAVSTHEIRSNKDGSVVETRKFLPKSS
jgi:hypothetical protein